MELSTKAKMATVGVGMKKSSPDQVRKAMRGPLMQDIAMLTAYAYHYKNEEGEHPRSDEREGCEVRGLLHCQQVVGHLL